MNPCVEHCWMRFGKQYSHECDKECDFAKVVVENKELKQTMVQSMKHGHWIHTEGNLYCCSVCSGYPSYIPAQCRTSKFCPNCGAKMDMK